MNNKTQIADLSKGRVRLRITGDDRVTFLNGQCTNDIKQLRPGQSCYAAFLNAKGKMRGDAYIICCDDALLLDASDGLQASLEKFVITEDVTIEDVSATLGAWLIVNLWERPSGRDWPVHRSLDKGGSGQECPSHKGDVPAGAITFAHPLGLGVLSPVVLPVTLDALTLNALRLEAGIPQWGVDMDENTIPVEAGLAGRAISYDKGCYIGQETIARIKTYGHVNRQLVQLSVVSDQLSVKGERISAEGKEVGHVTSAAHSNRLGKMLALGYVRREFAVTGVKLMVGQQPAEVVRIVS